MDGVSNSKTVLEKLVLQTSDPYDLIPRVFDFARRSSITLESLETISLTENFYEVGFFFRPSEPRLLRTLAKRAALIQSGMDQPQKDDSPKTNGN